MMTLLTLLEALGMTPADAIKALCVLGYGLSLYALGYTNGCEGV